QLTVSSGEKTLAQAPPKHHQGHWSLRTRIILVLIALVIIALGATDAITYTSLRSYLFQQVDDTLTSISVVPDGAVERALVFQATGQQANGELGLPNGTFAAIYDLATNGGRYQQLAPTAGWTGGVPIVPLKALELSLPAQGDSLKMTVRGSLSTRFRLSAENVLVRPGFNFQPFNGLFVVAIPLNGVNGTAH